MSDATTKEAVIDWGRVESHVPTVRALYGKMRPLLMVVDGWVRSSWSPDSPEYLDPPDHPERLLLQADCALRRAGFHSGDEVEIVIRKRRP